MGTIKIIYGKPKLVGDYLCIRPGSAHPEFCRIRLEGRELWYIGHITSAPLSKIEKEALFSDAIELDFSTKPAPSEFHK